LALRGTGIDELTLDVHASVIARLDEATPSDQGEAQSSDAEGDDEVLDNAGPLTLAIDVTDADAPAGEAPAAA
jgi:exoribonuclease-2